MIPGINRRKFFTFFPLLLLICHFHHVIAQIPNGGFELWEDMIHFEKPAEWWTNQDSTFTRIEKDTLAKEGLYSFKMVPSSISTWLGCESQARIKIDYDSTFPNGSILGFYVKSIPENPDEDTSVFLIINCFVSRGDSTVGAYSWRAPAPIYEFEKIEIPLLEHDIEELSLFIHGGASSHPSDGPCLSRSYSWIDGMTVGALTSAVPSAGEENQPFLVYPNPANGYFSIDGPDDQIIFYELFSLQGSLISKGVIDNNHLLVNDNGIYFLKLFMKSNHDMVSFHKIIVQK